MKYNEIKGDLIGLACAGSFDVIAHGVNCFCTMGAGLAHQMANKFDCDKFNMELLTVLEDIGEDDYVNVPTNNRGNINKLGQIDYKPRYLWFKHPMKKESESSVVMNHMTVGQSDVKQLIVVNAYTQYEPGPNLDYEALTLCLRKMNHSFEGMHIGLPLIGCGIAGGVWDYTLEKDFSDDDIQDYRRGIKEDVKSIIIRELRSCAVTIVHYEK